MKLPRKTQVVGVVALAGACVCGTVSNGISQASGTAQSKLALLIGVDRYRDPGIRPLSGCANDVANWEDVLLKKYGFAAGDILKLTDEKATKAAVKDAFAKHLGRATSDTVVFIAISSHGTQILDRNGDETTDALDETFVLHDSKISEQEAAATQLVDDEVNQLIADLNKKTQHVVLMADSCHSGTVTREAGATRNIPVSQSVREQAAKQLGTRSFSVDEPEPFKPLQGGPRYVLVSASKSTETAHEKLFGGKTNGAFTWFMTKALRQATDDSTYQDVFEKARLDVSTEFPGQHPEIEGVEQMTGLFGLKPAKTDVYLAVESVQGSKLSLGGGQLHGIGVGSRFAIFPAGTKTAKGATPLGTAEVKAVELTTSQAEVSPPGARIPGGARAFPTSYMVPIHRAKVFVPTAPAVMAQIRQALKSNPALELHDSDKGYDLRVAQDPGRKALVLEGGNSEPITDPVPESDANVSARMVERVIAWAKWLNVRKLQNPSQALDVSFKLVRLTDKADKDRASDSNLTRIIVGEKFELQVENRDSRPVYFNLLDLSSTGEITVAYPEPGVEAVVKPRETWKRRFKGTLKKGIDYDRDTAKLFVSTKPIDLRFVEQGAPPAGTRGERSVSSIVGDLVGKTMFGSATRGFEEDKDTADQWATREVVFEVQPEVTAQEQALIKTCFDDLKSLGIPWKKTRPMRGVVDPVELESTIGGVTFRNSRGKAAPMYMSCLFAEKVAKFAQAAAKAGVKEVNHLGIYNYRCIGGGSPDSRACKVSQHAYGRAIDFASFKTDKETFVIKNDWSKRPPPTCKATGGSSKAKFLRDLACEAGKLAGFNILLTPNYNAAHHDHSHADGTPNASFVRGGELAATGTDPAEADLGD
jgi:hypothetical protein